MFCLVGVSSTKTTTNKQKQKTNKKHSLKKGGPFFNECFLFVFCLFVVVVVLGGGEKGRGGVGWGGGGVGGWSFVSFFQPRLRANL